MDFVGFAACALKRKRKAQPDLVCYVRPIWWEIGERDAALFGGDAMTPVRKREFGHSGLPLLLDILSSSLCCSCFS
jgi:hypothetical protein